MTELESIQQDMIDYINENPHTLIAYIRPKVDNGFGNMIPDITADPVPTELGIGRVSRRRIPEPFITNTKTPYDYQDVYYLICPWDATWLKQDITFDYFSERYRTLYPEERIMYGGVAWRLADLEQITPNNVESLT